MKDVTDINEGRRMARPVRLSSLPAGIFKARNNLPASQILSNSSRVFPDVAPGDRRRW
ncbi:hypothetical protein BH160DRAFT_5105 [Burkholderia sp. H160]|nr:hypothetical protein BH160DRAFT_5105 [Burkholderia sp. H160]